MPSETRLAIELDILSGLPNPRWELAGETAARWLKRLTELVRAPAVAPREPPSLGYRGLLLSGGGQLWRVFGGQVEQNGRAYPDGGAEEGLLATIPSDLRQRYGAALPPTGSSS